MKILFALICLALPVVVLALMYMEGGLLGAFLYFGYALGAFVLFKLPLIALDMLKC